MQSTVVSAGRFEVVHQRCRFTGHTPTVAATRHHALGQDTVVAGRLLAAAPCLDNLLRCARSSCARRQRAPRPGNRRHCSAALPSAEAAVGAGGCCGSNRYWHRLCGVVAAQRHAVHPGGVEHPYVSGVPCVRAHGHWLFCCLLALRRSSPLYALPPPHPPPTPPPRTVLPPRPAPPWVPLCALPPPAPHAHPRF